MPDGVNADWLEEVLRLGDNRTLLPLLVRQINEGGVVPFAGAGLSAPYNLPQWSELIKGLAPDPETRDRVEALLAANEYEAAAEYLMDVKGPRQFQLLFRTKFEAVPIDLLKSTAITQLSRLGRGPIITTNFDRVIETVLEHEGCRLEVIAGENKSKISEAFQYRTDALLKVHGDIQDPEGRVLSKKEYDEAYSRWLDLLFRNVATDCLLFLGCSLKTDRPMQVLADLVKGGHGLTHHYAILALPPTDEEVRNRSKLLSEECHIHVIWYPGGKHEFVAQIVEYLADQLEQPSGESVARLYKIVGGNPLAIEWVVGTMRCGVELAGFLTRIENGRGEILSRVLGQVWKQIDAGKRDLLFAFSIFVRPPLEEVLQVASGLEKTAFYDDLDTLMHLYLVKGLRMHEAQDSQLTGHRYIVHPFARDFFEKQKAGGKDALYPRMAAFYAEYVSERGGTPEREDEAAIRELNGERDNILGVLDGCWKIDAAKAVVPVVQAMARWLFTESHWEDLEDYGTRATAAALASGEKHAAARILAEVGRVYSYRSEYERAAETFTRASKLAAAKPGDKWAAAYIQHHIGESLTRQKKYREARTILLKSLDGFKRINSTRSIIGVRYRLAMLAFEMNKLDEARRLAQMGAEDTSRDRWERMEGFNRRLLGDIAVRRKDFTDARFQYGRALKLVPRTDMRIQALIEFSLAQLEAEDGHRNRAREQAAVAASHFEKLRMPREAEEAHRLAVDSEKGV